MNDINLLTWFSRRKVDYLPKHFVPTNTPIDGNKHLWVLEKCRGRYFIGSKDSNELSFLFHEDNIFFEDPQEAVLYELTWS
jgi:hypothetical protein